MLAVKNSEIKEFIKEVLVEITRYEKETGKKYDSSAIIESYVKNEVPPSYAFTMTEIPKVGLNPKTDFSTPAGVYFYPLDTQRYIQLIKNTLPYASGAPYCNLLKLNYSGKWLIMHDDGRDAATEQDKAAAINLAVDELKRPSTTGAIPIHSNAREVEEFVFSRGLHVKQHGSIDSFIFDLSFWMTRNSQRRTVAWTNFLRKLGYVGIYDHGNSILHPGEPWQGVLLEARAYDVVNTFETDDIRKVTRTWSQEKINTTIATKADREDKIRKIWEKNIDSDDPNFLTAIIENPKTPPDIGESAFLSYTRLDPSVVNGTGANSIRLIVANTGLPAFMEQAQIAALQDPDVDFRNKKTIARYTYITKVLDFIVTELEESFDQSGEKLSEDEENMLQTVYGNMTNRGPQSGNWKDVLTRVIKLGQLISPQKSGPYENTDVFEPILGQLNLLSVLGPVGLEATWDALTEEEKLKLTEDKSIKMVLLGVPSASFATSQSFGSLSEKQLIDFVKEKILLSDDPKILQACLKTILGNSSQDFTEEISLLKAYAWYTKPAMKVIPTKIELIKTLLKNELLSSGDRTKAEAKLQALSNFDVRKAKENFES